MCCIKYVITSLNLFLFTFFLWLTPESAFPVHTLNECDLFSFVAQRCGRGAEKWLLSNRVVLSNSKQVVGFSIFFLLIVIFTISVVFLSTKEPFIKCAAITNFCVQVGK